MVTRKDETARLALRNGRVVKAAVAGVSVPLASQTGMEGVLYALGWTDGRFDFLPREVADEDQINAPLPQLLIEYAKRTDEQARWAAGQSQLSAVG